MLKGISRVVIGITTSCAAFAGTSGQPSCLAGSNVSVPCEHKQWDIGVSALYLKSMYGANFSTMPGPAAAQPRYINNDYGLGYRLEGSYHFNTGNFADINWTHFDKTTKSIGVNPGSPLNNYSNYILRNKNNFDQVNAVFGQQINFSSRKSANIYAGMQYVDIRLGNSYNNSVPVDSSPMISPVYNFQENSSFDGFGPVVGADFAYKLGYGVSVLAGFKGSILYGSSRADNAFEPVDTGVVFASTKGSKKAMVPGLEGKLGVDVSRKAGSGDLTVEVGFQALNYFHAVSRFTTSTGINRSGDSSYSLAGPFIDLHWLGDV